MRNSDVFFAFAFVKFAEDWLVVPSREGRLNECAAERDGGSSGTDDGAIADDDCEIGRSEDDVERRRGSGSKGRRLGVERREASGAIRGR